MNNNYWMYPQTVIPKNMRDIKWEGKKATLTLSDGTVIEFPIKSLHHYVAVKRFVDIQ